MKCIWWPIVIIGKSARNAFIKKKNKRRIKVKIIKTIKEQTREKNKK